MTMAGILFASAGAEGKPTMPIGGAVSIEFGGDLIFIGVGSLFLGLVLIRRKHVGLKQPAGELGRVLGRSSWIATLREKTDGVNC